MRSASTTDFPPPGYSNSMSAGMNPEQWDPRHEPAPDGTFETPNNQQYPYNHGNSMTYPASGGGLQNQDWNQSQTADNTLNRNHYQHRSQQGNTNCSLSISQEAERANRRESTDERNYDGVQAAPQTASYRYDAGERMEPPNLPPPRYDQPSTSLDQCQNQPNYGFQTAINDDSMRDVNVQAIYLRQGNKDKKLADQAIGVCDNFDEQENKMEALRLFEEAAISLFPKPKPLANGRTPLKSSRTFPQKWPPGSVDLRRLLDVPEELEAYLNERLLQFQIIGQRARDSIRAGAARDRNKSNLDKEVSDYEEALEEFREGYRRLCDLYGMNPLWFGSIFTDFRKLQEDVAAFNLDEVHVPPTLNDIKAENPDYKEKYADPNHISNILSRENDKILKEFCQNRTGKIRILHRELRRLRQWLPPDILDDDDAVVPAINPPPRSADQVPQQDAMENNTNYCMHFGDISDTPHPDWSLQHAGNYLHPSSRYNQHGIAVQMHHQYAPVYEPSDFLQQWNYPNHISYGPPPYTAQLSYWYPDQPPAYDNQHLVHHKIWHNEFGFTKYTDPVTAQPLIEEPTQKGQSKQKVEATSGSNREGDRQEFSNPDIYYESGSNNEEGPENPQLQDPQVAVGSAQNLNQNELESPQYRPTSDEQQTITVQESQANSKEGADQFFAAARAFNGSHTLQYSPTPTEQHDPIRICLPEELPHGQDSLNYPLTPYSLNPSTVPPAWQSCESQHYTEQYCAAVSFNSQAPMPVGSIRNLSQQPVVGERVLSTQEPSRKRSNRGRKDGNQAQRKEFATKLIRIVEELKKNDANLQQDKFKELSDGIQWLHDTDGLTTTKKPKETISHLKDELLKKGVPRKLSLEVTLKYLQDIKTNATNAMRHAEALAKEKDKQAAMDEDIVKFKKKSDETKTIAENTLKEKKMEGKKLSDIDKALKEYKKKEMDVNKEMDNFDLSIKKSPSSSEKETPVQKHRRKNKETFEVSKKKIELIQSLSIILDDLRRMLGIVENEHFNIGPSIQQFCNNPMEEPFPQSQPWLNGAPCLFREQHLMSLQNHHIVQQPPFGYHHAINHEPLAQQQSNTPSNPYPQLPSVYTLTEHSHQKRGNVF